MIGNNVGTPEALDLAGRLSSWHDAMVSHERIGRGSECDDECPHADAGPLWQEAVRTFGAKADELRFLRSRGSARTSVARAATEARL
jgi:hypothetical protein